MALTYYIQESPTSRLTTGNFIFAGSTSAINASKVDVMTFAPGYSFLTVSSDDCTSAGFFGGPVLSTRNSVHNAKPFGDSAQSVGPKPPYPYLPRAKLVSTPGDHSLSIATVGLWVIFTNTKGDFHKYERSRYGWYATITSVPVLLSTQRCNLGTCGGKSAGLLPMVSPGRPRFAI